MDIEEKATAQNRGENSHIAVLTDDDEEKMKCTRSRHEESTDVRLYASKQGRNVYTNKLEV